MAQWMPLDHGATAGFGGYTILIIVGVLVAVAAVGFGIWWLMQRRRYE